MRNDTYLEVNLSNFKNNLEKIMSYVSPKEVMPVIKADGYGMGIKNMIGVINELEIKTACVALVIEGIELKQVGYKGNVLVINPCMMEELEEAVQYDLSLGASIKDEIVKINELAKQNNKVMRIHLEIETGMHRTGIKLEDLHEYIQLCKGLENIKIDGVYTHFATSDELNSEYMKQQASIFEQAVHMLNDNNIFPKYVHMSNSGGIQQIHNDNFTTAVRPGLIIYGHNVNDNFENSIGIKPVSRLISKVTLIKNVDNDNNNPYAILGATKIATIPIGYADGYPRALSNKGKVVINNNVCNIIGNVLMDNILVDVSSLDNVNVGDVVYIWDNEKISVEDIAKEASTINYEILSRISPRVERRYVY